jgi:predicted TIM-barrel fold metal-dependent hydrolase
MKPAVRAVARPQSDRRATVAPQNPGLHRIRARTHAPPKIGEQDWRISVQGKIVLEEHFAMPETLEDSAGFVPNEYWTELKSRLMAMQDRRLREMDARTASRSYCLPSPPRPCRHPDRARAIEIAQRANDFLAGEVARRPDRFQGLAAFPMQDPDAAARELARCVRELGFRSALANGYSQVDLARLQRRDAALPNARPLGFGRLPRS